MTSDFTSDPSVKTWYFWAFTSHVIIDWISTFLGFNSRSYAMIDVLSRTLVLNIMETRKKASHDTIYAYKHWSKASDLWFHPSYVPEVRKCPQSRFGITQKDTFFQDMSHFLHRAIPNNAPAWFLRFGMLLNISWACHQNLVKIRDTCCSDCSEEIILCPTQTLSNFFQHNHETSETLLDKLSI